MSSTTHRARRRQTPEQKAQTQRRHLAWLTVLVLLAFATSLGGEFVWRDREDILQGANRLHGLEDLPAALSSSREAYRERTLGGFADPAAGSWQPMGIISYSLGWALWGDCAVCFHIENVLLHTILVIGLYLLGQHLLSRRRHGRTIAFWAAALFAVHPATVSSVAWIGGRTYLLAAVFSVWCLIIFSRLQSTTHSRRGYAWGWPAASALVLTGLVAMLSHETAYMLPMSALLIAAFESKERGRTLLGGIAPPRIKGLLLLCGLLLGVLAYRAAVLGGLQFSSDYPSGSTLYNIGTALHHLWFLIEQAALPFEAVISDARPVTRSWGSSEVAALLGLLLLLGATALGFALRQPAALGVAWFLIWVIPGVGIFPSSHYHTSQTLYLASWGLTFSLAYVLFLLWRPLGRQLVSGSEAIMFLPIVIVLAIVSNVWNGRWWDQNNLFEAEIARDPHYIEGRLELAKTALEQGDAQPAINHLLAAVDASRDKAFSGYWPARDAFLLLGRAQRQLDMHRDAVGSFQAAAEVQPEDARPHYWLGVTQLSLEEFEGAEDSLRTALSLRPNFPEAEADLGVTLVGQGRFDDARPLLADALNRGLGNARRYRAMALTMLEDDLLEDAARYLEQALAEDETAQERARLAWVSWRLGQTEKAHSEISIALELEEQTSPYVDWVSKQISTQAEPVGQYPPPEGTAAAQ